MLESQLVFPKQQSCHSQGISLKCKCCQSLLQSIHFGRKCIWCLRDMDKLREIFLYAMDPGRPCVCSSKRHYLRGAHPPWKSSIISFFTWMKCEYSSSFSKTITLIGFCLEATEWVFPHNYFQQIENVSLSPVRWWWKLLLC